MRVYKCDKCGKEIEDEILLATFTIERDTRLMKLPDRPEDFHRKVELCPGCVQGLLDLVNSYFEEGEGETKHEII